MQIKAAQAASVQAGKAARRQASARAIPVTDTEIALYGTGRQMPQAIGRRRRPNARHRPRTVPVTGTAHETQRLDTEPATEHDDPDARISKAITEVEDAAQRIGAEQADRHARGQYAARLAREAQAQPEAMAEPHADMAARAPVEAEIEM